MNPLFETKDLAYGAFLQYGDLSLPAGKITFLTGESGAGKSTLFKLLNGVLSPTQGSVFYSGQDIGARDPVLHRQEVSLVSQDAFLFDGSIRENFHVFYGYRNMAPPADSQINSLLSIFNLDFSPDSNTQTLSGGEKQRLYLAIFMSFKPKVLLLDEPTSALDARTGEEVLSNIIQFCRQNNMELLAISHNRDLVQKFSQNTLDLKRRAAV